MAHARSYWSPHWYQQYFKGSGVEQIWGPRGPPRPFGLKLDFESPIHARDQKALGSGSFSSAPCATYPDFPGYTSDLLPAPGPTTMPAAIFPGVHLWGYQVQLFCGGEAVPENK